MWSVVTAFLPIGEGAGAVNFLGKIAASSEEISAGARTMQAVRAAGEAGETAAGITKNTERIASASGKAAYRIPDQLDHGARVIGEVKNVARQGLTSQIQDFISYATDRGYKFVLYVRSSTTFTPALQDAIRAGSITVRTF